MVVQVTEAQYQGSRPFSVEVIEEFATLRSFLADDPADTVYMLGDLDPRYFHATRWFGAVRDKRPLALAMHFIGHAMPIVHTHGDPHALVSVLELLRAKTKPRFELHLPEEHLEAGEEIFPEIQLVERLRMRFDGRFEPAPGADDYRGTARLAHADTAQLVALYARAGISYFDPYQIETGLYFGLRDGDELVSAAGVHVVLEEDKVAAIGNVATHPYHRGQGYSKRCMGRLLAELLRRRVRTIVLDVNSSNEAAIGLYRSLGFREHSRIYVGTYHG